MSKVWHRKHCSQYCQWVGRQLSNHLSKNGHSFFWTRLVNWATLSHLSGFPQWVILYSRFEDFNLLQMSLYKYYIFSWNSKPRKSWSSDQQDWLVLTTYNYKNIYSNKCVILIYILSVTYFLYSSLLKYCTYVRFLWGLALL